MTAAYSPIFQLNDALVDAATALDEPVPAALLYIITDISENPLHMARVTTATAHAVPNGATVTLDGTNCQPAIDGARAANVVDDHHIDFLTPIMIAGDDGTVTYQPPTPKAFADVDVAGGFMAGSVEPREWLLFLTADAPEDFVTMARNASGLDEEGIVEAQLCVRRSGAGETVRREAAARAKSLIDALERMLALDRTIGGRVLWSRIGNKRVTHRVGKAERMCFVEFSIAYKARLQPGA